MEKTVVPAQEEKAWSVSLQMVWISLVGVLIGCVNNPIAYAFAFFYLAYFYMRDEVECRWSVVGILLGSLLCGIFITYLYALGITIFFISIHVVRLWNKNMYYSIPYICALLCIPYGFYSFGVDAFVFVIPLCVFALMRMNDHDYGWIQKRFVCTSGMYGICILAFTFLGINIVPVELTSTLLLGGLLMSAFLCDTKTVTILLVLSFVAFPIFPLSIQEVILIGIINLWKKERIQLLLGLLVYGILVHASMELTLVLAICAIIVCFYDESVLPFMMKKEDIIEPTMTAQSVLRRQIQNFSSIFQSLAQYYETISVVEAQVLSEMALALKYSADTLKKLDVQDNQKERILKALEGYQYDVLHFDIEEAKEGTVALDMDIRNIHKSEIKQTLLPLLEVLTHEHLKVSEVKHRRFQNGYHHITMENHVPYCIDAYADSQKNMYESSGDSFSIFRFRNTMIAMISDGMGSGEKAAASSRLITNVFQRMVFSGIPKLDSIRCINKLLQSDAYATLDVVCFDMSKGKAYIFKSAACPTFLIRDDKLYEVNGSALPVGIISSMEPDCFVADLKEGDEYLMVSDGIFMDEIYRWMRIRTKESAKVDCEALMQILREKQRLDDSTAVFSRIQKAER